MFLTNRGTSEYYFPYTQIRAVAHIWCTWCTYPIWSIPNYTGKWFGNPSINRFWVARGMLGTYHFRVSIQITRIRIYHWIYDVNSPVQTNGQQRFRSRTLVFLTMMSKFAVHMLLFTFNILNQGKQPFATIGSCKTNHFSGLQARCHLTSPSAGGDLDLTSGKGESHTPWKLKAISPNMMV